MLDIKTGENYRMCAERLQTERDEARDEGYRDGRHHTCALLSLLVYDSDGAPMNQASLLGLCEDVESGLSQP